MTQPRDIVCWQPLLTSHQAYTFQALGRAAGSSVTAFVAQAQDDIRAAQGWTPLSDASLSIDIRLLPQSKWLAYARQQLSIHRQAIHIFGSPFDRLKMMAVLGLAILYGLEIYLISEPYSPISAGYLRDGAKLPNLIKAKLRPAAYRAYGLLLGRRIDGVFAISPLAVTQYRSIGIPSKRVFPFGYFVPLQNAGRAVTPDENKSATGELRLICVATLIARKGIPELIAAVHALRGHGVASCLEVYGSGNPEEFQFDGAAVKYGGVIPFGFAQAFIAKYDLLVLPSFYDGWGVVVNEALMAGVPVVCSNRVGAGAVVKKWGCGLVYDLAEHGALEQALLQVARSPSELQQMRQAARQAGAALDPEVAGQYMMQVLRSVRLDQSAPACPWYD
jgi:glycosyltransferase involved in cell wall biosynthesis